MDDTELETLLNAYLHSVFATLMIMTLMWGMQILMVVQILWLFRGTSKDIRRSRLPYTIISCVLLGLTSVGNVTDAVAYSLAFIDFRNYGHGPMEYLLSITHVWWLALGTICNFAVNFLGDGVLLYRCYLIWQDTPWVLLAPALVYLSFVGAGIAFAVEATSGSGDYTFDGLPSLFYALSATFNILVTSLIAGRLLAVRRRLAKVLSPMNLQTYTGVVSILVESAVPLSAFAVVAAVMNALPVMKNPASLALTSVWAGLSVIAPQLIILRVASGTSWTRAGPSLKTGTANITGINFVDQSQDTEIEEHQDSFPMAETAYKNQTGSSV